MQPFRELRVWRRAHGLADVVCTELAGLPPVAERLLGDQMRRAARSVYANIAEGCSRESPGDFARFLRMAHGSAAELLGDLLLVQRRCWLPEATTADLVRETEEIMMMLNTLHAHVRRAHRKRTPRPPPNPFS